MGHMGTPPWLDCPRKILRFSPIETLQIAFPRFLSIKLELASLESMYVTPDLSSVEVKILCAVAQALDAEVEILGAATQRHSSAAAAVVVGCGTQRGTVLAQRRSRWRSEGLCRPKK